MLLRLTGFAIILFWLASMTWLVWQDVWPGLTAGNPPRAVLVPGLAGPWGSQVSLHNKYDQRIGTAWTTYSGMADAPRREDTIHLHSFPMLGRTLIEIDSVFTAEGQLDEFELSVWTDQLPVPILTDPTTARDLGQVHVKGERFASVYGFTVRVGPVTETFKIPASQAGLIGDVFRPFAALPDLHVGQSWRMQVVNPVAAVSGFGDRFTTLLVRVTGRETITATDGRRVDCLVVEAPNLKAWVDEDGEVQVQKAELPIGGTLTARAEAYDQRAKYDARAEFTRLQPEDIPDDSEEQQ